MVNGEWISGIQHPVSSIQHPVTGIEPLLVVRDLRVHFPVSLNGNGRDGVLHALDGVSFELRAGETLALVGETGSGKTTLARALLGLHPPGSVQGSLRLAGQELSALNEAGWRAVRWRRIALAVQGAGAAFDPVYRVGEQIAEPLREHLRLPAAEAEARATALALRLELAPRHLHAYPHQLSGGELQRALLAMALSCGPELLIADEPTSGQDVFTRARLVQLLRQIAREEDIALLLISHDLSAVAQLVERVAVLYAGKLLEVGDARGVLEQPRHPYTWGLRNAYPSMSTARDLSGIRGQLPDPTAPPTGCRFHPRCTQAVERCRREEPPLVEHAGRLLACHLGGLQVLLRATGLRKTFEGNNGRGIGSDAVEAVRRADLEIYEGEVVALVGETGSGKSTIGRMLVGQLDPDAGQVIFEGHDLGRIANGQRKRLARRIQWIPQDPFEAVSPRLSVLEVVREPLDVQGRGRAEERAAQVRAVLQAVNLPVSAAFLAQRAHDLSGGQLQRVAIARALTLEPKLLVADEPVSMLDASERAKVLILLKAIQNARGLGMLLISHDLALVRKVADRMLVLREGEIVEGGAASRVLVAPRHAYTRALLQAAPSLGWEG